MKASTTKLIRQNSLCWLVALLLPLILQTGLSGTRFPWPALLPVLLFPAMLASNRLLSKAALDASSETAPA